MKKYITIVLSLIMVIILILIVGIIINIKNKEILNEEIIKLKDDLVIVHKYLNMHEYENEGVLSVSAKYKGAHGENYPRDFVYNFEVLNNKINLSNEKGFSTLNYDNKLLNIINIFKNVNMDELKNVPINIDRNKFIVDTNYINDLFNTNFNKIIITLESKGIIKKVVNKTIIIDDVKIKIEDKNILISYGKNKITININDLGYTLNINDTFKMNAFLNDDKNSYSLIINNYVFYLELYKDEIIIKASSESSIYNGIDLVVNFRDVFIDKENEKIDDNNPIIRYLNNIDVNYWR